MKYVAIVIIVLVGALIVWACYGLAKGFVQGFAQGFVRNAQSNSNFHVAYRQGFKRSFLNGCTRGSTDARRIAYCTCADDQLESRFDDAGLMAIGTNTASTEQQAEVQQISRSCALKNLPTGR
jgi:hypothetical protein